MFVLNSSNLFGTMVGLGINVTGWHRIRFICVGEEHIKKTRE